MIQRLILIAGLLAALAACEPPSGNPVVNSGSYDWTDQVRDARGYPLPGWSNAIGPNAGQGGPM